MLLDKASIRDLIIVEVLATMSIAFAYFVWPYPPLAWEYDYSLVSGVNFFTISMAVTAWMLVGYVLFLVVQSLARFALRVGQRLGFQPKATVSEAVEVEAAV